MLFELSVRVYLKENGKKNTLRKFLKDYKRGIITLEELRNVRMIVSEN